MQVVAVYGDIAGAVFFYAHVAERQLEQHLSGVPLPAGEFVRMNANPTQLRVGIEMAQHLHHIRRNVNASADPLESARLLVKSDVKSFTLQKGGGGSAPEPCADDGNPGSTFHASNSLGQKTFALRQLPSFSGSFTSSNVANSTDQG